MKKYEQTGSRILHTTLKPLYAAMLPLLILGLTNQALANDWTAGTGDWFTAGNWGGGVPTAADGVNINNGGTAQIGAAGAVSEGIRLGNNGEKQETSALLPVARMLVIMVLTISVIQVLETLQ